MLVKSKLSYIILGFILGMGLRYTLGPSIQTFGTDQTPPYPVTSSVIVPSTLSNKVEFEVIDKNVKRFINNWEIAGASVAIAKDGRLVFAKGYGYADRENQIKIEPHHLFRTASISKLITAVGIMKLIEDGLLSLDDNVFGEDGILNFAPYNNYLDKRVEQIKILHLLNHSGGWTSRWGDPMFMPAVIARDLNKELPVNDEDIISFMLNRRLHFNPGTMSVYSNLGYVILGKVIESLSGTDYESYIKTTVFYPLGIFNMQLGDSFDEDRADLEVKYYECADSNMVDDYLGLGKKVFASCGGNDIRTLGAAGGWIGSATDILKFLLAIDGMPYPQDILSKESIDIMTTPIDAGFDPLGWRAVNSQRWYRTGTLSGTSTFMARKQDGFSYVVLCNSSTWKGPMLATNIRELIEKSISKITDWHDVDLFDLSMDL